MNRREFTRLLAFSGAVPFVTPDLAPRLASIRVDADNRASDHQPVIVELR